MLDSECTVSKIKKKELGGTEKRREEKRRERTPAGQIVEHSHRAERQHELVAVVLSHVLFHVQTVSSTHLNNFL